MYFRNSLVALQAKFNRLNIAPFRPSSHLCFYPSQRGGKNTTFYLSFASNTTFFYFFYSIPDYQEEKLPQVLIH